MWMMAMRNSMFDMHGSLSAGMATLKGLDYKYLNLNSILTSLQMNYDLPKPWQNYQKSQVQAFFFSVNNAVFTLILNPP